MNVTINGFTCDVVTKSLSYEEIACIVLEQAPSIAYLVSNGECGELHPGDVIIVSEGLVITTEPPEVECILCQRRVRCIRVQDGTVYRPLAWAFPNEVTPMHGICGGCR